METRYSGKIKKVSKNRKEHYGVYEWVDALPVEWLQDYFSKHKYAGTNEVLINPTEMVRQWRKQNETD